MRRTLLAAILLGAMALSTGAGTAPAFAGPHSTSRQRVDIVAFAYHPNDVTVAPGAAIVVRNYDWRAFQEPHTLTAVNGSFDTGIMAFGPRTVSAPAAPGNYWYFCTVHGPAMFGVIRVAAR